MFQVSKISSVNTTLSASQAKILVFIDGGVETPQFLAQGIIAEATAFILDSAQDGIKQITAILQDYPQVESIHLVSHGSPGSIQLGNTYLSLDTLAEYQQDLEHWHTQSLLIYGCNVAAWDAGAELLEKLHHLTGANIAGSKTKTGNPDLGGDWNLQVQTNSPQVPLAFTSLVMAQYSSVLVERVSVDNNGTQGNSNSYSASISGDSRYVAFDSGASNLVEGDTNQVNDVFVYNRDTKTTELVSIASDGTQGNRNSYWSSISGDGRYVTFDSGASNLVEEDTNQVNDVFVYDRDAKTTELVSIASDGTQGNSNSNGSSISGDGRYVAFYSYADNLVEGDTNQVNDVFVYDRDTKTTELVSIASDGTQSNDYSYSSSISGDGRYVTFSSDADNLVAEDTNARSDIFVYDRDTKTTELVSITSDGTQGNGYSYESSISGDGRFVTFLSSADNLVAEDTNARSDIFVYDRETKTTELVSVKSDSTQGNNSSYSPSISGDGRYVTFSSDADNLVEKDTNASSDVFVVENVISSTLVAAADINTIDEDRVLSVAAPGVLSNDMGDGITVVTTSDEISAKGARVTVNSDGSYSYDPKTAEAIQALGAGETLSDTFNYTIGNSQPGTAEGTVAIKVTGVNDAPIARTILGQIANDTDAFNLDVSTNFQDADDSDRLSFSARGLPEGLSISPEGMISGQTQANGFYNVVITASDLSASAQGYFELTVSELISGTETDEQLVGNSKLNEINGLEGNDTISGLGARDRLSGGDGDDQLFGGEGKDRLVGNKGDDQLFGGNDSDRLFGGRGNDTLVGDEGADVFILQPNLGLDAIADFKLNEDSLRLGQDFQGNFSLRESAGDTTISILGGNGETAIALLQGVTGVSLEELGLAGNQPT
jgi:VCBS repeat-containing protein